MVKIPIASARLDDNGAYTKRSNASRYYSFKNGNYNVVHIDLKGCLHEKKCLGYSPVNRVPWLAGMILIFVYIRSFVPLCKDEHVTWYCFEFGSV